MLTDLENDLVKPYITVMGLKETYLGLAMAVSLVAVALHKVVPSTVAFYGVS